MKNLFIGSIAILSLGIASCSNFQQSIQGISKEDKLKIYNETKFAAIKADSLANAIIPLKKELESKLENNDHNIAITRKYYQAAYDKWYSKHQFYMNIYSEEIRKKYNLTIEELNRISEDVTLGDAASATN